MAWAVFFQALERVRLMQPFVDGEDREIQGVLGLGTFDSVARVSSLYLIYTILYPLRYE